MHPACGPPLRRLPACAALLVPAALTIALTLRGGGYFAAASALAATEMLLVIALWMILAARPLAHWSRTLSVAVGSLAALAGWTALSASWSVSPELALPDAVRAILYASVLVLGALAAPDARSLRVMVGAATIALVGICIVAVASRTLPDVVSGAPGRLAHPLSYSNALGFAAAAALVLLAHLAAAAGSARMLRLAAVAAIPLAGATLIATASAGAAAAAAGGIGVYAVLARSRMLGHVVLAAIIPTGLAIWALQSAPVVLAAHPPSSLWGAHRAALALVACAAGAAALLSVAQRLGDRAAGVRLSRRARAMVAVLALCAVVPLQVAGAGAGIRVDYWQVAAGMALDEPLRGEGAGSFALIWPRERDVRSDARDAHSLYLGCVAELGIVGLGLLLLALGAMLRGLVARLRSGGGDRELYCALLAMLVAWMLHAGVDWLWEQPAVGLWLFAAAGAALAKAPAATVPLPAERRGETVARGAAIAACVLAAVVSGRLALASSDYEASLRAARTGHCGEARRRAQEALRVRPTGDAHLVLAACLIRTDPAAALASVDRALARDPLNWRVHYDRAVALASNGRDPRPEAGAAHGLNLLEGNTLLALERFGPSDPALWRAQAARARFLLP